MKYKNSNTNITGVGLYTVPIVQFCFSLSQLGNALKAASIAMRNFVECSQNLIHEQSGRYRYTKRHPIKGKHIMNILKKNLYAN